MGSTGVVFLQSDVDDAQKALGTYKPGNTDLIRQMLREQQKECQALHANGLFREFRDQQKQRKFGKGYAVQEVAPPMFDDFQAEGQQRMFELIKESAVKEEKPLKGVWATFGKPYICLGDPNEVSPLSWQGMHSCTPSIVALSHFLHSCVLCSRKHEYCTITLCTCQPWCACAWSVGMWAPSLKHYHMNCCSQ